MTRSTPRDFPYSILWNYVEELTQDETDNCNISNTIGPFIDENGIVCLGNYNRYWQHYQVRNPDFDDYSDLILEVKKKNKDAINKFIEFHENILFQLFSSVALATVPSSKAEKEINGIREVAMGWYCLEDTVHLNNHVFDLTDLFVRHTTIKSSHSGGSRTIKTHMDSIKTAYTLVQAKQLQRERPQPPRRMDDDVPLWIIDDVTTSGSSLLACRKIALKAGFSKIILMALGKTVGKPEILIDWN